MQKQIDFSLVIAAISSSDIIDSAVLAKAKKLVRDLEGLGVDIQTAFISSGHIPGGSIDLATKEQTPTDGNKE